MDICLYFNIHESFKLKRYTVFDIKKNHNYFEANKPDILKLAARIDELTAMLSTVTADASFSISGISLEQLSRFAPETINSLRSLKNVEYLGETYHNSFASFFSMVEFKRQVTMHKKLIEHLFDKTPKVLKNTDLHFTEEAIKEAEKMGFLGMIGDSLPKSNLIFKPESHEIRLLGRNRDLSNDLLVRFNEKHWSEYPLTPEKYAGWVTESDGNLVNIFLDLQRMAHNKKIIPFLKEWIDLCIKKGSRFITPSTAIKELKPTLAQKMQYVIWDKNMLQSNASKELYSIEEQVLSSQDPMILNDWRRLSSSDYISLMDTNIHMNHPYDTPYDTFIAYMNILNDLILRLNETIPIDNSR